MKQPLLSICIPTWNRRYSLQHCINSIIEQNEFKSGDVEIVISDNDSTDETEAESKLLCNKYANFKYYRNEKNIGAIENINKAYSLGSGKYLWCLSSHTKANPLSLRRLLKLLEGFDPDLLMNFPLNVNFNVFENKFFLKSHNIFFFDNLINYFTYLGNQFIYDKNSFSITNNLFSNMGCPIIKKIHYDKTIGDIIIDKGVDFFNSNNFIHLFIAYYNGGNKKIILDMASEFSGVGINSENKEKEIKTGWNRKDKIYMEDAHYFTEYIRTKYLCHDDFLLFLKYFDRFWCKLYIINNIPFIDFVKKLFSENVRAKIWNFIGNK